ncbi:MAG: Hsp70 family protein [Cyanobium sp.]
MRGTLAIDLGSTTTVVAYQDAGAAAQLLALPPYSSCESLVVPTLLWLHGPDTPNPLIGRQVLEAGLAHGDSPQLHRDFKRHIGAGAGTLGGPLTSLPLSPEQAGALLLQRLWAALPAEIEPQRLVLTAPIDSYLRYRQWLVEVGRHLEVEELALVDEPTAAAIGAGLPAGSKVLVVDLGGGTIDLSLVALEGGEGRPAPMAQLLRFAGRDLGSSRQALRCARVIGKAGLALGGRDFDRWIAAHLCPGAALDGGLLAAAENLKCQLSSQEEAMALWSSPGQGQPPQPLRLNRRDLNELLRQRGLVEQLDALLDGVLAGARREGLALQQITAVLPVGGSSRLPLIRQWLTERFDGIPLRNERPVEAVALGALALTPGVQVRDVLRHGVCLRCWDQRSRRHHWQPLFVAGQTWPSERPLEVVLACSSPNQHSLEIVLGEPDNEQRSEVVFEAGLPVLRQRPAGEGRVLPWGEQPRRLQLASPGQPGEDCLRLAFQVNGHGQLVLDVTDLRSGDRAPAQVLGPVR